MIKSANNVIKCGEGIDPFGAAGLRRISRIHLEVGPVSGNMAMLGLVLRVEEKQGILVERWVLVAELACGFVSPIFPLDFYYTLIYSQHSYKPISGNMAMLGLVLRIEKKLGILVEGWVLVTELACGFVSLIVFT